MRYFRSFMGCMTVLFLFWLTTNVLAFVFWLLFSNDITGTLTLLAVFLGLGWFVYKVMASVLNDKKEK